MSQNLPHSVLNEREFGHRISDLSWIDLFAERIRPYVRVRVEDGVLIKLPMEVYQLNPAGCRLLARVLNGEAVRDVAGSLGAANNPDRIFQIHTFFCDIRDLLQNRMGDGRGRPTTRVTKFEGSFTKYPVLSEIAVTYRCNLACAFCYAGCGTNDASAGNPGKERRRGTATVWQRVCGSRCGSELRHPQKDEMTGAEVLQVIDEIATAGRVPSVSFTGGECTLRPELPEFIARAREREMRVNIITNGVACSSADYVKQLTDAGLTSAQVSLSGPSAEIHDRLAQKPGAFEKAVQGIKNLRDAGLHVHTNTTICRENADHLCDIVDLANSLCLPHVSMNQIIPTGTPTLSRFERLQITYNEIGRYVMQVKRHAERAGIDFHWYSPTPFCIFNPIAHGLGNKGCAACDGLLHVSPSGEVLPCSSFSRGVGNLLEDGFEKIWFGRDARFYREKRQAPAPCRGCQHFELCQGACTLYWSEMGEAELIEARGDMLEASEIQKAFCSR
jgi:radical SAM protein with 4Fe4S-binding SPASM domain